MLELLCLTSTSASFEITSSSCFYCDEKADIYVNDEKVFEVKQNVFTLNNLKPSTEYTVWSQNSKTKEKSKKISIKTNEESGFIDARDFGAVGDGKNVDTCFLQAAIASCPKNGRVIVKKGIYLTGPLFLKSDITIELQEGAVILGLKDRKDYPILQGTVKGQKDEFYLGSWEGCEQDIFASLITGIGVSNVNITGKGVIDGNADFDTWWYKPKEKNIAYRPRTVYINNCSNILLQGVTIKNSPSWTIHPLMSRHLKFINLNIENPFDAPNTDALDPESCEDVLICGDMFSVGDDCIAIKSGKIARAQKDPVPSKNIQVRNCIMKSGHGAVVIGSEMSSGVMDVFIEKCIFDETDRGLRIKTRRGRGSRGIIDNICLKNVEMNKVLTPFAINCFYFCDSDGKTEYVWSKEKLPVDCNTPYVGRINIENVVCKNSSVCAAFMYGLPERKIEKIQMKNVFVDFYENAKEGYPDMMSFIQPMKKNGMYFNNIKHLLLDNVKVKNSLTEDVEKSNIEDYFRN